MKIRYERIAAVCVAMLILVSLMFIAADTIYAGLDNDSGVLNSWDYTAQAYVNGNANIPQDGQWDLSGGWQSFYSLLGYNGDLWPDDIWPYPLSLLPDEFYPCYPTTPSATAWAAFVEATVFHTDTAPGLQPGFLATRNYKLYECDRDGDNAFSPGSGNDESIAPPTYWITEMTWCDVRVIDHDTLVDCPSGNCEWRLQTGLIVNCDLDCDGNIDQPWPNSGACVYFEAQRPPEGEPLWSGNFQGRIAAGTGDKTINFDLYYPTAVTLKSFVAYSAAAPYVVALLGLGIGGVVLLYWRSRRRM